MLGDSHLHKNGPHTEPGSFICPHHRAVDNGIRNINVIPPFQHLTVNHTTENVEDLKTQQPIVDSIHNKPC